jgi:uncharacterized membrane protein YtjA (UPF0391 family)
MVVLCSLLHASPAHALFRRKKKVAPKKGLLDADVDRLVDLSWPILHNLGFSGIVGVVTGIALKVSFSLICLLVVSHNTVGLA